MKQPFMNLLEFVLFLINLVLIFLLTISASTISSITLVSIALSEVSILNGGFLSFLILVIPFMIGFRFAIPEMFILKKSPLLLASGMISILYIHGVAGYVMFFTDNIRNIATSITLTEETAFILSVIMFTFSTLHYSTMWIRVLKRNETFNSGSTTQLAD
ncbi:hypothetical protein ACTWQB_17125 [Piscibacillus sp. B03]|uniref:hypothetical protein n=1 Tax=Piscibacillus sp. B03 TaxID=3457430 RepID=UPI003FCD30CE